MKPFVKWAGGKRALLEQLAPLLPSDVAERRYFEPFVGGGSLFFYLKPEEAFLTDANAALVTTYLAVRDRVSELIRALKRLAETYTGSTSYYAARDRYNSGHMALVDRAALFIYLNRLCFNGLYRVNKTGVFNVPYGRYKNPTICDVEGLRAASAALQGVWIAPWDFRHVRAHAGEEDFVYFDPPYVPLSETSSFEAYTQNGFGVEGQVALRKLFGELDAKRCKVMLSNSDTAELRALYKSYNVHTIQAPRAINSKAKGRGAISEIVVTNY